MTPVIDKRSTGPRTAEGKAISALNGETHGFTSVQISPKNEKGQAILIIKREGLVDSLKPSNFLENSLVETMAAAETKKDLIEQAQAELETNGRADSRFFENLQRYWKDADRAFHRAMNALQTLRRDAKREIHQQFREDIVIGRLKADIANSLHKREKSLKGTGRSLFDGPNSDRLFELRLKGIFQTLPTPAHRPNPANTEARPVQN